MSQKSPSFQNKNSTTDEMGKRFPHPRPSKVNHRLEIARHNPIQVNSKKMLLIRYKNIFTKEGGKDEDIECLGEMLNKLDEKSDEEEQVSFKEDSLKNSSKNINEDQNSNDSFEPLYDANELAAKRDEIENKESLMLVLSKKSVADENPPENNDKKDFNQSMLLDDLPNNSRRLSNHFSPLNTSFERKQKTEEPVKDHSNQSFPGKYVKLNRQHIDLVRSVAARHRQHNQLSNYESNEKDVGHATINLADFNAGDIKNESTNFVEDYVVEEDTKNSIINLKKEMQDDIEAITIKLKKCFNASLTEHEQRNCICNRPVSKTRCTLCGITMNGRIIRHCEYHPKAHLRGDNYYCNNCMADISYLREVNE